MLVGEPPHLVWWAGLIVAALAGALGRFTDALLASGERNRITLPGRHGREVELGIAGPVLVGITCGIVAWAGALRQSDPFVNHHEHAVLARRHSWRHAPREGAIESNGGCHLDCLHVALANHHHTSPFTSPHVTVAVPLLGHHVPDCLLVARLSGLCRCSRAALAHGALPDVCRIRFLDHPHVAFWPLRGQNP